MEYKMNVENRYFNLIRDGHKKIEMRLAYPERREMKPGDIIIFSNNRREEVHCIVTAVSFYKNFNEIYDKFPHTMLGYPSDDMGIASDMQEIYPYAAVIQFGVMAIEIAPFS